MKLPKLSVRLHGGMTPAQCVDHARMAEYAGFHGVQFAENAFGRGILPAAAACAVATSRLRIGAGVFNPFSRHPTMMAMEIGALDELSGGRASISLGSGIGSAVEKLGHSAEKPLPALRDTLIILRGLLRGDRVDYIGRAYSARNVKLDYAARTDIPVHLAGRGDLTVRLAGEIADGLVVSNMCSVEFSRRAAGIAENSRVGAGRPEPIEIIQYLPCAIDENRERAIQAAKRAIGQMLPNYWGLAQRIRFARMGLVMGTGISEAELAAAADQLSAGGDPCGVLDERYVAAFSVAGTPYDCCAAAARYAEAGVTHLALTIEGSEPMRAMLLLGNASRSLRS